MRMEPSSWTKPQLIGTCVKIYVFFATAANLLQIANGITNLADIPCGKESAVLDSKSKLTVSERRGSRILNGVDAQPGEFPWIASIRFKWGNHFCSGVIINRRYLLSAAHCFHNPYTGTVKLQYFAVSLGMHNLNEDQMPSLDSKIVTTGIENITIHPEAQGYVNDVALLRLDTDIQWTRNVRPACLTEPSFQPEGSLAVVAGWGTRQEQGGKNTYDILQKVEVPILQNEQCQNWFSLQGLNYSPKESQMCAGYIEGGKDSCRGDSGGPLMIQPSLSRPNNSDQSRSARTEKEEQIFVVGIVAAGKGCGRPQLPGVYTRLSHYVDWIRENIKD